VKVLYAGRQTKEKGIDLLIETFKRARALDPRLHLLLAGGGPEQARLRSELGEHATSLGWLEGEELARAYASADAFLFCSRTDTFGQVIVEAQASGLPVVSVGEGGPASLIADGRSGLLREADPTALATALCDVVGSDRLRRRLVAGGLDAASRRTWRGSMDELAAGYAAALDGHRTAANTPATRSA
jgi:glycosyltransferase involved in cell wall biosynthesis